MVHEMSDTDSENEFLELAVLAMILRKKKRKKRGRRIWVQEIFQKRNELGITRLVEEMKVSNREAYFK